MSRAGGAKAIVAVAAGLIAVGLLVGWLALGRPSSPAANAPVAAPTPAEYRDRSRVIVVPLRTALAAESAAGLPAAATAAKNALMMLTVPGEVRDAHLALVLAISRAIEDPSAANRDALRAAVEAFLR